MSNLIGSSQTDMQLMPTVGLSNEAIEQIRQIVREEIQLALQVKQEKETDAQ